MDRFGHFKPDTTNISGSYNLQLSKTLIIYICIVSLDVTNFDIEVHPSNIFIVYLKIRKLST
jgi:hypothetical protein